MNTNKRIEEELANSKPCRGLYMRLKNGCKLVLGNWEEYMVNTITANQVEHIVCMQEGSKGKYFLVKPETRQCEIKLRRYNNTVVDKIKVTYLPINCNISTNGHNLQGKIFDNLIITSWAYKYHHWVYVVFFRVRNLKKVSF